MELSKFVETNGLSYGEVARLTGYNRTTVSRVARMEYPNWEQK